MSCLQSGVPCIFKPTAAASADTTVLSGALHKASRPSTPGPQRPTPSYLNKPEEFRVRVVAFWHIREYVKQGAGGLVDLDRIPAWKMGPNDTVGDLLALCNREWGQNEKSMV